MVRILIADDDATVRDLARRALEGEGHMVATAGDGGEALEQVKANGAPDLLVTDVDMPNMDGIALAREIASGSAGLAVLLMSGYVEQLARAGEIKAAKVATLRKPFSLEAIRESVRSLMR